MSSPSKDAFMRPMEYRPEVVLAKTRRQVLLDQLGLADEDLKQETSSSSDSDSEGSPIPTPVFSHTPSSPAHNEMKELKQMLRQTQHKLRAAQSSMAETEHGRERRLKIMRKTHQSALALKEALIQELQDMLCEREEQIVQLEASLRGSVPSSPVKSSGLKRLVEQMSKLHKAHSSLQMKYEQVLDELEQLRAERERLQDELLMVRDIPFKSPRKPASVQLVHQVRELQQKVLHLEQQGQASLSRTDTEKVLQLEVVDLKAQLKALQAEKDCLLEEKNKKTIADNRILSQLKEEVSKLHSESATLRTSEKELTRKAVALEKSLDKEREAVRCTTATQDQLKKALATSETKVSELEGQVSRLADVVKEAEGSEERLAEECRQCREQLRTLGVAHHREVEEMTNRHQECVAAREDLESVCSGLRSQLEASGQQRLAAVKEAEERGRAEAKVAISTFSRMHSSLSKVKSATSGVRTDLSALRELAVRFSRGLYEDTTAACRQICHKFTSVSSENKALISKYRREMLLRKRLHNQLVELRGNIRVLCRLRPPIAEDGSGSQVSIVAQVDPEDDGILHVHSKGTSKMFELDRVFGPQSSQEEVFGEVKPLVTSCMDGYNICIFAYGQTGSGKTFTMEGPVDNPGINQRALLELFATVEERRGEWEYSILVSVLEIYNECVRDLLAVDHTEKKEVKQGPTGMFIPGLTQVQVTHLEEVNEVFALGHENRSTGATKMNIQSSRSHALLCITVMGINKTTGVKTVGKLNLIDLAGSERLAKSGSDGARLQEARHINKSLSALGDVIHSLRSKAQHIPYRNSKLTYLLHDSLSGDSKTLMVVQVAPVEKNVAETVCSLTFAQRVRAVELGQASKKVIGPPSAERARGLEIGPSSSPFKTSHT